MNEPRVASKCNNRDHAHYSLIIIFLIIGVVVGGFVGFFMGYDEKSGDPDTPSIGRIYEVIAVERVPGDIEDYVLLALDRAEKEPKVEFMKIPVNRVEGTILAGKGILRVEICATSSCQTKTARYKAGEFSELEKQLKLYSSP